MQDEIGLLLSFIQLYESTPDKEIKDELKVYIVKELKKLNGDK